GLSEGRNTGVSDSIPSVTTWLSLPRKLIVLTLRVRVEQVPYWFNCALAQQSPWPTNVLSRILLYFFLLTIHSSIAIINRSASSDAISILFPVFSLVDFRIRQPANQNSSLIFWSINTF